MITVCHKKYFFAFWQKLGNFIEAKAKKSTTSPGLVSPDINKGEQVRDIILIRLL
jgi:hypothetical protein